MIASSILGSGFPAFAVELAAKSILLLAVVLSATWFMRRASAAVRHLLLSAATVGLVALPIFATLMPSWNLGLLPELRDSRIAQVANTLTKAEVADLAALPSGAVAAESSFRMGMLGWAIVVWGAGTVTLILGLVGAKLYASRAVRRATVLQDEHLCGAVAGITGRVGLTRAIQVVESDRFQVPCVSGTLRPRLVLPVRARSWPWERLEAILRHELAHVRRSDNLIQFLAQIACCVYWLNPLVWVLERKLFIERERACDDTVLRQDIRPSDYAHHLMEVMEEMDRTRSTPWLVIAMAQGTDFKDRILSVLNPSARRDAPAPKHFLGAIALLLLLVLPLSVLSPWTPAVGAVVADEAPAVGAAKHTQGRPTPGDRRAVEALIRALVDRSAKVREQAATALGNYGDELAVQPLCWILLNDPEARVREHAATALGQIGNSRAGEALAEAVRSDPEARVREHAAIAMGQLEE